METMFAAVSVALLILSLGDEAQCQIRNRGFFDYGPGVNDTTISNQACSDRINLNFSFFGHSYDRIYVCDNGFLSTQNVDLNAGQFTATNIRETVISVYATEIHTHFGGDIYYRDTTNATILNRASRFVKVFLRNLGMRKPDYAATRAIIATWNNVQANGMVGMAKFQTALVTDGTEVYVINNYGELGFGDEETVLVDKTGINNSTNANEPGRHIFRIDQNPIVF